MRYQHCKFLNFKVMVAKSLVLRDVSEVSRVI
jgi:hypothetical protein